MKYSYYRSTTQNTIQDAATGQHRATPLRNKTPRQDEGNTHRERETPYYGSVEGDYGFRPANLSTGEKTKKVIFPFNISNVAYNCTQR